MQTEAPHCLSWFRNDNCDLQRQAYQQLVRARVVAYIEEQKNQAAKEASDKKQEEIDTLQQTSSQQSAQLLAKIDQLSSQKLQAENNLSVIEQQTLALLRQPSHEEGMHEGEMMGFGFALVAFVLLRSALFLVRNFRVSRKEEARAASA